MKHEKNPKHEPPMPHEPPRKEKKKHRRRGGGILILLLLLIIAILILLFFNPFGWGNGGAFGLGGQQNSSNSSDNSSAVSDSSESVTDTVMIKIENEDIYFDGELCTESELREKVIALGTEKKYELEHSLAIKSTYDSVTALLTELEDALGITVNYNE